MPSYDTLWALRTWLDSWPGIGHVAVGLHRQGFDLQLTQHDERVLATKYRTWSRQLAFDYPYVASLLEEIAARYDHEADRENSDAAVRRRLRH